MNSLPSDCELLSPLPGKFVKARFTGPYKGERVIWNLKLMTVAHYIEQHGRPAQPELKADSNTPNQFIFIKECGEENNITVAMSVPIIDEFTLIKAMIMIKNYKRLRAGWHFWGDGYVK